MFNREKESMLLAKANPSDPVVAALVRRLFELEDRLITVEAKTRLLEREGS